MKTLKKVLYLKDPQKNTSIDISVSPSIVGDLFVEPDITKLILKQYVDELSQPQVNPNNQMSIFQPGILELQLNHIKHKYGHNYHIQPS